MSPVRLAAFGPAELTRVSKQACREAGSPELPPWLGRRHGRQRLELLQLSRAQAPSPFNFKGMGHAEGPPVPAQRLGAPADSKLLEALVVEAGHLGRGWRGGHAHDDDSLRSSGDLPAAALAKCGADGSGTLGSSPPPRPAPGSEPTQDGKLDFAELLPSTPHKAPAVRHADRCPCSSHRVHAQGFAPFLNAARSAITQRGPPLPNGRRAASNRCCRGSIGCGSGSLCGASAGPWVV